MGQPTINCESDTAFMVFYTGSSREQNYMKYTYINARFTYLHVHNDAQCISFFSKYVKLKVNLFITKVFYIYYLIHFN